MVDMVEGGGYMWGPKTGEMPVYTKISCPMSDDTCSSMSKGALSQWMDGSRRIVAGKTLGDKQERRRQERPTQDRSIHKG
jgi:hypothetical protein